MSTEKKSKSTKDKVKSSSKDKVKSTKSKPKKADTAVAQLCKGKTSKGEACSRKGIHDGYCYQHSPNAVKGKTVKPSKPTKLKVNSKTGKLSYKGMIGRAIVADADKKGSSRQSIKKYLEVNFKVEKKDWFRVNSTLAKMLESEEIAKNPKHQGHFKLTPDFRKLVETS